MDEDGSGPEREVKPPSKMLVMLTPQILSAVDRLMELAERLPPDEELLVGCAVFLIAVDLEHEINTIIRLESEMKGPRAALGDLKSMPFEARARALDQRAGGRFFGGWHGRDEDLVVLISIRNRLAHLRESETFDISFASAKTLEVLSTHALREVPWNGLQRSDVARFRDALEQYRQDVIGGWIKSL